MTVVWVGTEWSKDHQNWIPKVVFRSALRASGWVLDGILNHGEEPVHGERNTERVELIE